MTAKKKEGLGTASSVLQAMFENGKSPLSHTFLLWKISQNWQEIIGATIAEQTQPIGYRQGVFYILCSHPVWIQQLTFMLVPMRKKINTYVGRPWVQRIRFTLDRKVIDESSESPNPYPKI